MLEYLSYHQILLFNLFPGHINLRNTSLPEKFLPSFFQKAENFSTHFLKKVGQKLLYIGFVGILPVSSDHVIQLLPGTYKHINLSKTLPPEKFFAYFFSKKYELFSKSGKLLYIGFVEVFTASSDFIVQSLPRTYKFTQHLAARKVFAKLFSKSEKKPP